MPQGLPGLVYWRREAALSQRELASKANVGHVTIARLETAQVDARPSTVRKLAAALRVQPNVLLHRPVSDDAEFSA